MRQAISLPEQNFFILYNQSLLWAWSEICRETSSHPEKTENLSHIFPSYASWSNNRYYLVLKKHDSFKTTCIWNTTFISVSLIQTGLFNSHLQRKGNFKTKYKCKSQQNFFSLGFLPLFLAYDGSDAESK